jgi:hypothetical protein
MRENPIRSLQSHLQYQITADQVNTSSSIQLEYDFSDRLLDEFTFRFNRRRSKSRGKLFFRLAQQAVTVDPVTYYGLVHPRSKKSKPQSVGVT